MVNRCTVVGTVQVQPRVCGEYPCQCLPLPRESGSTPRMRGIYIIDGSCIAFVRFNPAYAGNIRSRNNHYKKRRVQPRVCGEYAGGVESPVNESGSTPRMRGISLQSYAYHAEHRFNPAYAGNILKKS